MAVKLLLNYSRDKLDESSLETHTFESNIAETKSKGEIDRITKVSFHPLAKPKENLLLSKNVLVCMCEPRANRMEMSVPLERKVSGERQGVVALMISSSGPPELLVRRVDQVRGERRVRVTSF